MQSQTITDLQKERENALNGMISILRSLNIPEPEIITQICEQYQIDGEQVRKYL